MPNRVVFSERALATLLSIETYLTERSSSGAGNVIREIHQSTAFLEQFPLMGTEIAGTNTRYHRTRKYKYRIVYRLKGERIEILQIFHPAQKK